MASWFIKFNQTIATKIQKIEWIANENLPIDVCMCTCYDGKSYPERFSFMVENNRLLRRLSSKSGNGDTYMFVPFCGLCRDPNAGISGHFLSGIVFQYIAYFRQQCFFFRWFGRSGRCGFFLPVDSKSSILPISNIYRNTGGQ